MPKQLEPYGRDRPAQHHNELWNELVDLILRWEDSSETAGELAREIITVVGQRCEIGGVEP